MNNHSFYNSGYSNGAASSDKNSLKEYFPKSYSAKSDIDLNLSTLRHRSADLATNSPIGSAAINSLTVGILGSGLQLFPTPIFKKLNISSQQARSWSRNVKLLFDFWADSVRADFLHRNNFLELQRIACQSSLTKGDSFVLFKRSLPSKLFPFTLKLQVIDAQRVSNPIDTNALFNSVEMLLPNGSKIVNGIEVDSRGRMTAIHVCNKIFDDPFASDPNLFWQRVRTFGDNGYPNILHICFDTRPEQFRGVPVLAPVVETLKQIARYSEAELTTAIIRSFFSIFFTQPNANFTLNEITGDGESPIDISHYKLGSGTINSLPRGVDVKAIQNSNVQNSFEVFLNSYIKQVGAALNLPYEVLMRNFQSSYSASRAALLQAEQEFRRRRAAFINDFCTPVYNAFLLEMVATGRISAPGFFDDPVKRYCWSKCDWRADKLGSIDEVKSATAAKTRLELGLTTREMECAAIGEDFYQNVENSNIERQLLTNDV